MYFDISQGLLAYHKKKVYLLLEKWVLEEISMNYFFRMIPYKKFILNAKKMKQIEYFLFFLY
jgi:hypothetical protein